jgi:hypothetical protein
MTAAAPASTASVAQELVTLCRAGRNLEAISKLYSPKIVSIEPVADEKMPAEMTGIEAIRGKNEWWYANNEVHRSEVTGPFVGEGQFAVKYAPVGPSASSELAPSGLDSVFRGFEIHAVQRPVHLDRLDLLAGTQ